MNLLQRILAPKSEKLARVEITRACRADNRDFAAGEVVELPEKIASALVGANSALLVGADDAAEAEARRLNDLLPRLDDPRPLPDEWSSLPPCFASWWKLNEGLSALVRRYDATWEILRERLMRFCYDANFSNLANAADAARRQSHRHAIHRVLAGFHIGEIPQEHLRETQYLRDAFERMGSMIERWHADNDEELAKVLFHVSQHTLAEHGKIVRSVREIHAKALELFGVRVAALKLGKHKVAELFAGSADAVRVQGIEEPTLHDIKLAFYEADKGPSHYLATSPAVQVELIEGWQALRDRCAEIGAGIDRELAAAKKASRAA